MSTDGLFGFSQAGMPALQTNYDFLLLMGTDGIFGFSQAGMPALQ